MKILGRLFGTRNQMSCRQVGKVLQTYLDNELDDDAARKVAAHLEDCRRCGLEADTYEALKASLQRGPAGLADEPVTRLREFGERLARGEIDPDDLPRTMTTAGDLETAPNPAGGLRRMVNRHAGLLAASAIALVWLALARRQPDTTYHFAPIIVAASWGAARRWVGGGPGTRTAGFAAAGGGATIAWITTVEVAWVGALDGPTLWGTSGAIVEAIAFAAVGAALGFRFVTRRRPGFLFAA